MPLGRRRPGQGQQAGFKRAVEGDGAPGAPSGLTLQRSVQAVFDEATLEMLQGALGDAEGRSDGSDRPARALRAAVAEQQGSGIAEEPAVSLACAGTRIPTPCVPRSPT